MKVIETERLILRRLTPNDAAFIPELLNDPTWIQFIGDKGLKTLQDAKDYIVSGPIAMYESLGFGLFLTELKDGNIPIGLCGLIKRDWLEAVDIGFAFLQKYQSKGFGFEPIVAFTTIDNKASSKLLEKIGLEFAKIIMMPQSSEKVKLFTTKLE